jgi:hypothetical protein
MSRYEMTPQLRSLLAGICEQPLSLKRRGTFALRIPQRRMKTCVPGLRNARDPAHILVGLWDQRIRFSCVRPGVATVSDVVLLHLNPEKDCY